MAEMSNNVLSHQLSFARPSLLLAHLIKVVNGILHCLLLLNSSLQCFYIRLYPLHRSLKVLEIILLEKTQGICRGTEAAYKDILRQQLIANPILVEHIVVHAGARKG